MDIVFLLALALIIFLAGSFCLYSAIVLVLYLAARFMDGVCVLLQWLAER